MLVARTKAKQDALPKRQVIVSSARILPRISSGNLRAANIRASEENRRMVQAVEKSIEISHNAVRVASETVDRTNEIVAERKQQEDVLQSVQRRLDEAKKELGVVEGEKNDVQKQFRALIHARDKVNSEISKGTADVVALEISIKEDAEFERKLQQRIGELTQKMSDMQTAKTLGDKEREVLQRNINHLKGRSVDYGKKIGKAKVLHQDILGKVEEATKSFQVFEYRILKLSQETGYTTRLPKLKTNV